MSANMTVNQLLAERERIDAAINAMGGAKKQEKKQKRKSAPAGPWAAWTKKMLEENKEAVEAFKAAQEVKLGAHLKWISANKGKDTAEYKSFAEAFAPAAAPEAEEVESVASEPSAVSAAKRRGPKKLADMTPEERAAHHAKIAARKAAKEAAKVAEEVAGKAAEETPVAVAPAVVAAPAAAAAPEEAPLELLPFKLDGVSYFRLGSKTADGDIEWQGDLWYNKKGVRGSYVGSLLEDGSIDTDAEEPTLE